MSTLPRSVVPVMRSMGSHQSARMVSDTWLTPPEVIEALGGPDSFDLDPCAAPAPRPWATARRHIARADGDGLAGDWAGRVWLNPPYSRQAVRWLARLVDHGCGTALVFARTETAWFVQHIWQRTDAVLFLHGRLHFHRAAGTRAAANAGAPSCLAAYGQHDVDRLADSGLPGSLVTGWRDAA